MLKKYAIIAGKLGLSIVLVWGIAWGIVTFNIEGEVDQSDALIWDMSGFERSNTQKFAGALKELGHEPPRVYNYNGNDVYVSTRKTSQDPKEAVREYQRMFVRKGINEEVYSWMRPTKDNLTKELDNPRVQKRHEAMLSGQIVPQWSGENYASMGGGLIKGQPETRKELNQQVQPKAGENLDGLVDKLKKAFKACDFKKDIDPESLAPSRSKIMSQASQPQTNVGQQSESAQQCGGPQPAGMPDAVRKAAVLKKMMHMASKNKDTFSDCPEFAELLKTLKNRQQKNFDENVFESFRSIEMFQPPSGGDTTVAAIWGDSGFDINKAFGEAPSDPKVPACPSCKHGLRYSSKPNSKSYVTNVYRSPKRPERLEQYYLQKMRNRGWERTDTNIQLDRIMRHVDGKFEQNRHLGFKRGGEYLMLNFQKKPDGSTAITSMETRLPRTDSVPSR